MGKVLREMLSVLILGANPPSGLDVAALSRTLAALVPHAVDGMVRDVHILAATPSTALAHLAEDAGASLHAFLAAAALAIKSERVLVLQSGMLAFSAVIEEIWHRGLARQDERAVAIKVASKSWSPQTLWRWAFPFIGGAVISRQQLSGLEKSDIAALHRRLKAPLLKAALQSSF